MFWFGVLQGLIAGAVALATYLILDHYFGNK